MGVEGKGLALLLKGIPHSYALVITILVVLVIIFAMLILMNAIANRRRAAVKSSGDFDGISRIRGRLERMDQNLNEFRTEMLRAVEFIKVEFEYLRNEMEESKRPQSRSGTGNLTMPQQTAPATPPITAAPQTAYAQPYDQGLPPPRMNRTSSS